MTLLLSPILAVLIAVDIWWLLRRTKLSRVAKFLIAGSGGAVGAGLLYYGLLILSICAFQWNDPITW